MGWLTQLLQIDKKYSEMPKPLEVYSFSQSKFIPDISFIVDGSYVARNVNDETFGNSLSRH